MYVRSPPGADQGPAQKKHAPISWHEWQGPGEHDAAASSRAERTAREDGPERRRQHDSADGGKQSDRDGREQRSTRRSPGKSRGLESSREWRERILGKAAAERGAAAETGARRSSREGSRGRSERQQEPRSEDRHRSADNPRRCRSSKSQSRDADPEGAAYTGNKREEVLNPRIGPAGPRELEETEEAAQLRRCTPSPDTSSTQRFSDDHGIVTELTVSAEDKRVRCLLAPTSKGVWCIHVRCTMQGHASADSGSTVQGKEEEEHVGCGHTSANRQWPQVSVQCTGLLPIKFDV